MTDTLKATSDRDSLKIIKAYARSIYIQLKQVQVSSTYPLKCNYFFAFVWPRIDTRYKVLKFSQWAFITLV